MNVGFKNFKRCVSLLLVLAMLLSTANLSLIMPAAAGEHEHAPTLGQIMAEAYAEAGKITSAEKEILATGQIVGDVTIEYTLPPEEVKDSDNLVIVNENDKTVTVNAFVDAKGNTWYPTTFDVVVGSEVKENDIELVSEGNKAVSVGKYTYAENAFSIVVTYVLDTESIKDPSAVTTAVQLKLLNAAGLLAEDVQYMDLINKTVCYETVISGQEFKLSPADITNLLTTKLPLEQLEGGTMIDMLNAYFVNEESGKYLEDVEQQLPNGEWVEIAFELKNRVKQHISNAGSGNPGLVQQQAAGGLLINTFYENYADLSVLEMIADDAAYAELENALNVNFEQFEDLGGAFAEMYKDIEAAIEIIDAYYAEEKPYEQISAELDAKLPDALKTAIGYDGVKDLAELQQLEADINAYVDTQKTQLQSILMALKVTLSSQGVTGIDVPTKKEDITSASLTKLSDDVKAKRDEALVEINTLVQDNKDVLPESVTSKEYKTAEDVKFLKNELAALKADVCAAIEGVIASSGYADELDANGGSATIAGSADVEKNIFALGKIRENVFAAVTEQMAPYATQLNALGVTTTTVTNEDELDSLINEINVLESNLPGKITEAENQYASVIETINGAIKTAAGTGTRYAMLQMAGLVPVTDSASLSNLVASANNYGMGAAVAGVASYVDQLKQAEDAIAGLKTLNEKISTIKSSLAAAKDGVVAIDETYLPKLNEAKDSLVVVEGALSKLDTVINLLTLVETNLSKLEDAASMLAAAEVALPELEANINQLEELEAQIAQLKDMAPMLNLLVEVLNGFCEAVKPVIDRFDNNGWNVDEVLVPGADYADITKNVRLIAEPKTYTDADVIEVLEVATAESKYNMSMFDIVITVEGYVADKTPDVLDLVSLEKFTETITLRKDSSKLEVMNAVNELRFKALAAWEEAGYVMDLGDEENVGNYYEDITEDTVSDVIDSDGVITVKFTPAVYTVNYFEEDGSLIKTDKAYYGSVVMLPKHTGSDAEGNKLAYIYTVNGAAKNQGMKVEILGETVITRTEGKADQYQTIVDLIDKTNVAVSAEGVITNEIVDKGESFWLVTPNKDTAVIDQSDVLAGGNTITVSNVDAEMAGLMWTPASVTSYDEEGNLIETVNFVGNTATLTDNAYGSLEVAYELDITVGALESATAGEITADDILAKLNLQETLSKEYAAQKAALNVLLGQRNNLEKIGAHAGDLSSAAIAASTQEAKDAIKGIVDELGKNNNELVIYTLLKQCDGNSDGKVDNMLPYYQNYESYKAEINKMLGLITIIENDDNLWALLVDQAYDGMFTELKAQFAVINASLTAPNANILDVNNAAIVDLLDALDALNGTGLHFDAVPEPMTWVASIAAAGPGSIDVKVLLDVNGKEYVGSVSLKEGVLTAENMASVQTKIQAALNAIKEENKITIDTVHNVCTFVTPVVGDMISAETVISETWTAKKYTVKIEGAADVTLTYTDATAGNGVTLPGTSSNDIAYVYSYTYTVNGETETFEQYVGAEGVKIQFPRADFDAIFADGTVVITRTEINLVEKRLIELFDAMKGAAVLTKNAEGKYAAVLPIVPSMDGAKTGLGNFAMGLVMGGSNYGYIGMGDGVLYDGSQYSLQTIVDVVMNSGVGTQTIIDVVDEKGNIDHMTLNGYNVIGAYDVDKLGGQIIKTTMSFGATEADAVEIDFYITLAEATDLIMKARKALVAASPYVSVVCENGMANAEITLPDQVYALYVAALSAVGEINLDNIDELNNQVAITYLLTVLDPVLNGEITTANIDKTLANLGQNFKLTGTTYGKIYNAVVKLYDTDAEYFDANGNYILPINNIGINSVTARLQGMVDEMIASMGVDLSIDLGTLIKEYKTAEEEIDGINVTLSAKLTNTEVEYAAILVDLKAATKDIIHIYTAEELVANAPKLVGPAAIILLDDVAGDLVFNAKTLLDLNGKKVLGDITANNTVVISDSTGNNADSGIVYGAVSGSATVVGGKYGHDVSAFLKAGYAQDANGLVYNKLFSVAVDGNNVTITLNATPSDLKEMLNKKSIASVGIDFVVDLLVNNYDVAALTVDGKQVYDINVEDIIGLVAGTNRVDNAIDKVLACVSAPELADLFNTVVADLTDFAALQAALEGDGKVASYEATVAPWVFELDVVNDALTANIVSSDETETYVINVVVDGDYKDELAIIAGALADTAVVESELTLEDIVRNDNDEIVVNGAYAGSVELDFTKDARYVIMMAVVLASNTDNAALKADVVEAIDAYYADHTLTYLEKAFDSVTAKQLCDALGNVARGEKFTAMVKSLKLSADAEADIIDRIGDEAMGYSLVIEVVGALLRQLEARELLETVTESGRTLGSVKKSDAEGKYYGFSKGKTFTGNKNIYSSYSVAYNVDVTEVNVTVRLFPEEKAIVVNDAEGKLVGWYDTLSDAFAALEADVSESFTVIVVEAVEATADINVSKSVDLVTNNNVTFGDYKFVLTADGASVDSDVALSAVVSDEETLHLITDDAEYVYTAEDHDWGDWTVTTEPTCTEEGEEERACSVCGRTETQKVAVDPDGHKWGDWTTTKEPDCTEDGEEVRVCELCGEEETNVLAATGHAYVFTFIWVGYECETMTVTCSNTDCDLNDTVDVTVTSEQTIDPDCCTTGEKVYTAKATYNGVDHYDTKTEVLPELGHNPDLDNFKITNVEYVPATSTFALRATVIEGYFEYTVTTTCERCDEPFEDTFTVEANKIAPDCFTDGEYNATVEYVEVWGVQVPVSAEDQAKFKEVIPSEGHDYVDYPAQEPTCTDEGWDAYKVCNGCGESTQVIKPALGHEYMLDEANCVWAADYSTCTMTFTCARGCGFEDTKVVNSTIVPVPPTCVDDAKAEVTASVEYEGETYTVTKTVVVPGTATGVHTPGTAVQENVVGATCGADGSYDEVVYCTVCNAELSREAKVIPATGEHTPVVDAAVEATCTTTGLTEGSHCDVCGTIIVAQEVVDALGHTWDAGVVTAPTCTEDGYTTYTCTVCGETKVEPGEAATGHTFVYDSETWGAGNGTCTITIKCACGETVVLDATVTSEVTTNADCVNAEITTYTATAEYEGKTYTATTTAETAPAKGHNFNKIVNVDDPWVFDITAMTATMTIECENCDAVYTIVAEITATTDPVSGDTTYSIVVDPELEAELNKLQNLPGFDFDKFVNADHVVIGKPAISDVKLNNHADLFGYNVKMGAEENILFLDLHYLGITLDEFKAMIQASTFENDANGYVDITVDNELHESGRVGTGLKITMTATNTAGESATLKLTIIVLGDLNGDGQVKSGDASVASQITIGTYTATNYQILAADINGDGQVRSGDKSMICKKNIELMDQYYSFCKA